jgi:PHD/YefM family antitoxin component YafN of YafNO toxin-antitoxin module
MQTQKVGIREFRDKLATYLLESGTALAIARHGDTMGYYLPARRKRTEAEKEALRRAGERMQRMMEASGFTEDDMIEDFKRRRREEREGKTQDHQAAV